MNSPTLDESVAALPMRDRGASYSVEPAGQAQRRGSGRLHVVEKVLVDVDLFQLLDRESEGVVLEEVSESVAIDEVDKWCAVSEDSLVAPVVKLPVVMRSPLSPRPVMAPGKSRTTPVARPASRALCAFASTKTCRCPVLVSRPVGGVLFPGASRQPVR